jgi:preprotein translocase subunit SecG
MELLASILTVLIIIASVFLILFVLVQSSKNEVGLFQSTSQSVLGSRSGDILSKITSILAAIFLLGSFALAYLKVRIHARTAEATQAQIQQSQTTTPSTTPATSTSTTGQQQARPQTQPARQQTTQPVQNQTRQPVQPQQGTQRSAPAPGR